jgi:23S rRNA maturation mini-RNase III
MNRNENEKHAADALCYLGDTIMHIYIMYIININMNTQHRGDSRVADCLSCTTQASWAVRSLVVGIAAA